MKIKSTHPNSFLTTTLSGIQIQNYTSLIFKNKVIDSLFANIFHHPNWHLKSRFLRKIRAFYQNSYMLFLRNEISRIFDDFYTMTLLIVDSYLWSIKGLKIKPEHLSLPVVTFLKFWKSFKNPFRPRWG